MNVLRRGAAGGDLTPKFILCSKIAILAKFHILRNFTFHDFLHFVHFTISAIFTYFATFCISAPFAPLVAKAYGSNAF